VIALGINIDHVATLRQARGVDYPDPIAAARIAEEAGADGITVHLREDRRHIQERDVEALRRTVGTRLNLEMAATDEMVAFALRVRPDDVCFVPERRDELTTEGGLDVAGQLRRLGPATGRLAAAGIRVHLFVDPTSAQLRASREAGAHGVELHTGEYANAPDPSARNLELAGLTDAATTAHALGLAVHAGHGLTLENIGPIRTLPHLTEVNIGHSIVARAVFVGLAEAVREMRRALT